MIRLLLFGLVGCACLLTTSPAHARTTAGDLLWQDEFDLASGSEHVNAMAANGGRVFVVGRAVNAAGNGDFVVRAQDGKSGALLWQDQIDLAGGDDEATAVVVDAQRVVVAGRGVAGGMEQLLLRAYHPKTGALQWDVRSPAAGVFGLAMDDGRVVVTGAVQDAAAATVRFIRSYAAKDGAQLWEESTAAAGLVALKGKIAFVVADVPDKSVDPHGVEKCRLRAYNLAKGRLLWESSDPSADTFVTCRPAAIATEGRYVLVAGQTGPFVDDFHIRSYDAETGILVWRRQSFIFSDRENAAVAVDGERHAVFVAGWRFAGSGSDHDVYLVQSYDLKTGEVNWADAFDADPACLPIRNCRARDLVVNGGRVFTAGDDGPGRVWFVRTYDATSGDILWTDRVEVGVGAPSQEQSLIAVQAIAVDDARIFVAGTTRKADGNTDFLVRAYDAK